MKTEAAMVACVTDRKFQIVFVTRGVPMRIRGLVTLALIVISVGGHGCATSNLKGEQSSMAARMARASAKIRRNYVKHEYMVPMRDGVKLFTAVYTPRRTKEKYPFLLFRTPYSCRPYGEDRYRASLGPNPTLDEDGYIFVFQDVRGKYLSEGEFVNMTPHVPEKRGATDVDESTDTYDTIEWLLETIPNHNGRAGMWGISYPGFYSAASMIDHHPALVAVSPQAPIADWYFDDFHHHGAFFLPHTFNFIASFGRARPEPTTSSGQRFDHGTPDGYQFFLDLGPLKNANEKYLHDEIAFWNKTVEHPNYDEFWQRRDILPHLHDVSPAVLTVGGWFDAEDLYGPLKIYRSVEEKNPDVFNAIVMGPWAHGGWARGKGDHLGNIDFGQNASEFYNENIITPFFRHCLKGEGDFDLPEAYVFETGRNAWHRFDEWPPAGMEAKRLFMHANGVLSFDVPPAAGSAYDEFVSDPNKPVPFTEAISKGMTREYMTDDQRFAGRRPDVLTYQTAVLDESVTVGGPIYADLWVSTSGTASDWVVKVIDVFPPDAEDHENVSDHKHLGNYQMMVRSEVIRGRFRNSYEHPEPFVPNEPTHIRLELQDVLHTFEPGHRIMVQIQSTWFPLVDRNPHRYVDNVFLADEDDFVKATQRVYRSGAHATRLDVTVLPLHADENMVRGAIESGRALLSAGATRILAATARRPASRD